MEALSGSGSIDNDCLSSICSSPSPTDAPTDNNILNDAVVAGIIVGAFSAVLIGVTILVVVLVMLILCLMKKQSKSAEPQASRRQSRKKSQQNDILKSDDLQRVTLLLPKELNRSSIPIEFTDSNNQPNYEMMSVLPLKGRLEVLEFPRSKICILSEVAETNVGKIYNGEVLHLTESKTSTTVLIKSLRERADEKLLEAFDEEIKIASSCNHVNVLSLLAVSLLEEPRYLIYEYMEYGNLKDFLISTYSVWLDMEADESTVTVSQVDVAEETSSRRINQLVGLEEMTPIAVQVAEGMAYLVEKEIILKRIATKDCQIGNGLKVKISDFGLSYDLGSSDFVCIDGNQNNLVPLCWMAPETLQNDFKHTHQSNVWSYGVFMWEVFSFGSQPYQGLTELEIKECILSDKVLSKPEHCSEKAYDIMKSCWSVQPELRPSFGEIVQSLQASIDGIIDLKDISRKFSMFIPSSTSDLKN
jgi:hypothetical protein